MYYTTVLSKAHQIQQPGHFFASSTPSLYSKTFLIDGILKSSKRWKSQVQDLGCVVGEKDSPFEFSGSCCVLKRVIIRAESWYRLMATTFWVRPVLKCCCKVLRVWVYRCVLVLPLVKKFPTFCATEGSSPCSQKPATWNLYSEPDESIPRPPFYFFKVYFNIIPQLAPWYSKLLLSFSFFPHHDPVCIFVLPYRCRMTHPWGPGDSTSTLCILGFHDFHQSVHANSRRLPEAPPRTHKIVPATTLHHTK